MKVFPRNHEAVIERNMRRAEEEQMRLALPEVEPVSQEDLENEQVLY